MNERTCKSVRTYYGFIFGAYTIVVGALFIWKVLSVYLSGIAPDFAGEHSFSRERVEEALSQISLFFWLWIAGIVVGFVLWEVFPVKEKRGKISPDLQLARLRKRIPATAPEGMAGEYAAYTDGVKLIRALFIAAWSLFGVAVIYTIIYLCIPSNFPGKNVTAEILNLAKHVFPCVFAGLLVVCAAAAYQKFAVKKLLPVARKLTAGQKPQERTCAFVAFFEDKRVVLAIRIALAVIAVALIIWGSLNGNARAIFIKAINICTECIGLG